MFSVKNAAYVAIMQIGVIVGGVLAAGFWVKGWTDMKIPLSIPVALLVNHTLMFLAIPLVWITFASLVGSRPRISDEIKNLAFWSGVLLLIVLVIFVIYADVSPFFSITWGLSGDDSA